MTPEDRQQLEQLIAKWRSESLELQADYDARSRQVWRAKGLHDCATDLLALLLADARPQVTATKAPEHVCGLSGYNGMIDPPCPACVYWRELAATGHDADGPIVKPPSAVLPRSAAQEEDQQKDEEKNHAR